MNPLAEFGLFALAGALGAAFVVSIVTMLAVGFESGTRPIAPLTCSAIAASDQQWHPVCRRPMMRIER